MFSVVMPSYNSAPFIEEAIESVLRQSHPELELIVCDDGSRDGTLEIVGKHMARDRRIRLLRNGFGSVSLNCNAAIREASYPWIARLDADDVMHPHRLQLQAAAIAANSSVVAWGGFAWWINRRGERLRLTAPGPTTDSAFRAMRAEGNLIFVAAATATYRRDVVQAVGGYDHRFDTAEDVDLLYRMMPYGSVRVIPQVLAFYRLHGSSFTASRAAHQERLNRYIKLRDRAHLAKADFMPLERYLTEASAMPLHERAAERIRAVGRQAYFNARVEHAEGRLALAAAHAGVALLLTPRRSLKRYFNGYRLRRSARAALSMAPSVPGLPL